eukprot:m.64476 g.64476  ORF g.64476 m.64476 type:complete len:58 (-) comp12014_c0_seq4:4356-4529(-)
MFCTSLSCHNRWIVVSVNVLVASHFLVIYTVLMGCFTKVTPSHLNCGRAFKRTKRQL